MTHRRIVTFVTLFVALFIASQATVVNAHDVCGEPPGDWCVATAGPDDAAPAPAPTVEQGTIYRVADAYLFAPVPGDMWAVEYSQSDGSMITEDFVSGPPPANSIAVTP